MLFHRRELFVSQLTFRLCNYSPKMLCTAVIPLLPYLSSEHHKTISRLWKLMSNVYQDSLQFLFAFCLHFTAYYKWHVSKK